MPRRVQQTQLTPIQAQAVMAGWVGLALLVLALVVWYAMGVRHWYTNALLVVAVLGLVDWLVYASPLVLGRFSPRQLAAEANASLFIVAVIGIVILLNYVSNRRHYEWDLTKNKGK